MKKKTKKQLLEEFYKRHSWAKEGYKSSILAYKNCDLYYDPLHFLIYQKSNDITFEEYLKLNEAQLLSPTNIYEMIRFRACDGTTCIIYQGKKGIKYSNELALEIHSDWQSGININHLKDVISDIDYAKKDSDKTIISIGSFNKEREIVIKYIDELPINKEKLYRFLSEEMGYLCNKEKIKEIQSIEDLRDIYKLAKQYRIYY